MYFITHSLENIPHTRFLWEAINVRTNGLVKGFLVTPIGSRLLSYCLLFGFRDGCFWGGVYTVRIKL